jgi:polyhydroxyalkanoate synthesis regulator phasin
MANEEGKEPSPSSRADALRAAVDQAFGATAGQASRATRDRASEVADELAAAAGRVRDLLDDLRPPTGEDLRALRERIDALEARVRELERRG